MDDANQLDQSDSKEDESCVVDNRQQSILTFFKQVNQSSPCKNVSKDARLSTKHKIYQYPKSAKEGNVEEKLVSMQTVGGEKSKQKSKLKRKRRSKQGFCDSNKDQCDTVHNCEVKKLESENELEDKSGHTSDAANGIDDKDVFCLVKGASDREEQMEDNLKPDDSIFYDKEMVKSTEGCVAKSEKEVAGTGCSDLNQGLELTSTAANVDNNRAINKLVIGQKGSHDNQTNDETREYAVEVERAIIDETEQGENKINQVTGLKERLDENFKVKDEDLEDLERETDILCKLKSKKKRKKRIDSESDEEIEKAKQQNSNENEENDDKKDTAIVRRSRRAKRKAVDYGNSDLESENIEDTYEEMEEKEREKFRHKVDRTNEKKQRGKSKTKNVDKAFRSSEQNEKKISQDAESISETCSKKELLERKISKESHQSHQNCSMDEGNPKAPELLSVKTNFLSKFSNEKRVRQEDKVILESETCLPTTSHVLQVTDAESVWYGSLPITSKKENNLLISEENSIGRHLVPDGLNWTMLLQVKKPTSKRIVTTSSNSASLDICLTTIMARRNNFPILDVLRAYLNCQQGVLQQCLAKAELMRSNLKMIWERHTKIEPVIADVTAAAQNVAVMPALDIRSMFKKGRVKQRIHREDDTSISGGEKTTDENTSKKENMKENKKQLLGDKKVNKCSKDVKRSKKNNKMKAKGECKELDSSIELVENPKQVIHKLETIKQSFAKVSKQPRKKELKKDEEARELGGDDDSTRRRSGRNVERKDYKEKFINFHTYLDGESYGDSRECKGVDLSAENVECMSNKTSVERQGETEGHFKKKKAKKGKLKKRLVDKKKVESNANSDDGIKEDEKNQRTKEKQIRKSQNKRKRFKEGIAKIQVEQQGEIVESRSLTPSNDIRRLFVETKESRKLKSGVDCEKDESHVETRLSNASDSVVYEVGSSNSKSRLGEKQGLLSAGSPDIRQFFGQKSVNCCSGALAPCGAEEAVKEGNIKLSLDPMVVDSVAGAVIESSNCDKNAAEGDIFDIPKKKRSEKGRPPKNRENASVMAECIQRNTVKERQKEDAATRKNKDDSNESSACDSSRSEVPITSEDVDDNALSKMQSAEVSGDGSPQCVNRVSTIMSYFTPKTSASPTEEGKGLANERRKGEGTAQKHLCTTDRLLSDEKDVIAGRGEEVSLTVGGKKNRAAQQARKNADEKLRTDNEKQSIRVSPVISRGKKAIKVIDKAKEVSGDNEAGASESKTDNITPRSKRKRDTESTGDPPAAGKGEVIAAPALHFSPKRSKRQRFDGVTEVAQECTNLQENDISGFCGQAGFLNVSSKEKIGSSCEVQEKLHEEITVSGQKPSGHVSECIEIENVRRVAEEESVPTTEGSLDSNDSIMTFHKNNTESGKAFDEHGGNGSETAASGPEVGKEEVDVMVIDHPSKRNEDVELTNLREERESDQRDEKSGMSTEEVVKSKVGVEKVSRGSDGKDLSKLERLNELSNDEVNKSEGESSRRRSSRVKQKEELRMVEEKQIMEESKLAKEEKKRRKEELRLAREEKKSKGGSKCKEDGEIDTCKRPASKKRKNSNKTTEGCSESVANDEVHNDESLEIIEPPESSGTSSLSAQKEANVMKEEQNVESKKDFEVNPITEDFVNSTLLWTEKYAPEKHDQVIGNESHCKELFEWLSLWKEKHEHLVMQMMARKTPRSRVKGDEDDSDFFDSDEDDDNLSNTYLFVGRSGCGTTAAVYACAQELGYKVLEMNPSSHRSGKQIQALLGEATQSHQVKRKFHGTGNESNKAGDGSKGLSTFFGAKETDRNEDQSNGEGPQKPCESQKMPEESVPPKDQNEQSGGDMSLILFEQGDVVFDEQDRGFWFGVNELRREAKRPIIITANDALVSFKLDGGSYSILTMDPIDYEVLANHLEAICLAEKVMPKRELISNVVANCNGDIRKSILKLQFLLEQWRNPCYEALQGKVKELMSRDKEVLPAVNCASEMISSSADMEMPRMELLGTLTCPIVNEKIKGNCSEFGDGQSSRAVDIKQEIVDDEKAVRLSLEVCDSEMHSMQSGSEANAEEVKREDSEVKTELSFEEPEITLVSGMEDSTVMDKGDNLFDVAKINKENLFACEARENLISTGACKRDLKNESDLCRTLGKIASSAEQLSSADANGVSDHLCLHTNMQPYSWWHGRIFDSIADEERFSGGRESNPNLKHLVPLVEEAFMELHGTYLNRHQVGSLPPDDYKRDTKELFRSVESCFPISGRLDHRAVCVEILPTLSIVCKSEENRKLTQFGRRSRRFLNYLDTIGFHLDPELQEKLIRTWVG